MNAPEEDVERPLAPEVERALAAAAEAIRAAPALLVTAGAGMGVDSGLPDFRGTEGFWKAYPPFRSAGLRFEDLANPRWFASDPARAWGFYGHRLELYRRTEPHEGFGILRRWAEAKPAGAFVFTSNVDGHFQRAGFAEDRVVECHGSIHFLQCLSRCGAGLFPADPWSVSVDEETFRARPPLPACPRCGSLARPAILMFGDGGWDGSRSAAQEERLEDWLRRLPGRPVVVETGAGTGVPTVRMTGEGVARSSRAVLVRVNTREPGLPRGVTGVSLPLGALAALRRVDEALRMS